MSDRCEPREHLRGVDGWHLLQYRSRLSSLTRDIAAFWHARDGQPVWNAEGRVLMPDDAYYADWHYVGQMATPAEVEALRRERDAAVAIAQVHEQTGRGWCDDAFTAQLEAADLRADNARLREALERIARGDDPEGTSLAVNNNYRELSARFRGIAIAAIKEPTP
jgi:hypothetical protein